VWYIRACGTSVHVCVHVCVCVCVCALVHVLFNTLLSTYQVCECSLLRSAFDDSVFAKVPTKSPDLFLNAGAPIWSAEWCPYVDEGHTQYLAVGTFSPSSPSQHVSLNEKVCELLIIGFALSITPLLCP
jgi:hypothetical protein